MFHQPRACAGSYNQDPCPLVWSTTVWSRRACRSRLRIQIQTPFCIVCQSHRLGQETEVCTCVLKGTALAVWIYVWGTFHHPDFKEILRKLSHNIQAFYFKNSVRWCLLQLDHDQGLELYPRAISITCWVFLAPLNFLHFSSLSWTRPILQSEYKIREEFEGSFQLTHALTHGQL